MRTLTKWLNRIRERQMLWSPDVIEINKKISAITNQSHRLAMLNQQGVVDPDIFISKSNQLAEQLRKAKQEKDKLLDQRDDEALQKTRELMEVLECGPEFPESFDVELFCELVVRVIVSKEQILFCHNSPSIEEGALQSAILAALNSIMSSKQTLINHITDAMGTELVPHPDSQQSLGEINDRIEELEKEFSILFDETSECDCPVETADKFLAITQELAELKKQRKAMERQQAKERKSYDQVKVAQELMMEMNPSIMEWNEVSIRQLVHTVKVMSAELIEVYLNDGKVIRQSVENKVRKRRP